MVQQIPAGITQEQVKRFKLHGDLWPLVGLVKATGAAWRPSRPFGGWLATYGKIGPDGGIVPTQDRDGHVFEAAREIGHIDWRKYIKDGWWNDTHDRQTIVGQPTNLEFHDGTSELSKSHGKVGFWTTGHLFDRDDPKSWDGLKDGDGRTRIPTEAELTKADYFWSLSHMLEGTPRPLGFSADGLMAMSQCRRRILWARVGQAAVCEMPVNPDATAEPLIYAVLGKARVGDEVPSPCARCNCPPGACESIARLQKNVWGNQDMGYSTIIPQLADGVQDNAGDSSLARPHPGSELENIVLRLIMDRYFLSPRDAKTWLDDYFGREAPQKQSNGVKPNGKRGKERAAQA